MTATVINRQQQYMYCTFCYKLNGLKQHWLSNIALSNTYTYVLRIFRTPKGEANIPTLSSVPACTFVISGQRTTENPSVAPSPWTFRKDFCIKPYNLTLIMFSNAPLVVKISTFIKKKAKHFKIIQVVHLDCDQSIQY